MLYHSSADLEDLIKVLQIPVIILSGQMILISTRYRHIRLILVIVLF